MVCIIWIDLWCALFGLAPVNLWWALFGDSPVNVCGGHYLEPAQLTCGGHYLELYNYTHTISEFSVKLPNSSSGMRNRTNASEGRSSGERDMKNRKSSSCFFWTFRDAFFSGLAGKEVAREVGRDMSVMYVHTYAYIYTYVHTYVYICTYVRT